MPTFTDFGPVLGNDAGITAEESSVRGTATTGIGLDAGAATREIKAATEDLKKVKDPEDRKNLEEYIQSLGGQKAKAGVASFEDFGPVLDEGKTKPTPQAKPRSDASIALGGVAAATHAVASEAATLGDMLLNAPNQIVGLAANAGQRLSGLVQGKDRKATAEAGAKSQHDWEEAAPNVLKKFMSLFPDPNGKDGSPGHIETAMNKIMDMSNTDAQAIEDRTGKLVLKEDVMAVRDTALGLLGVKGLTAPAKGVGKALADHAAKQPYSAVVEPPVVPKTPNDPTAVKQNVERVTGVTDVAARDKVRKAHRAEIRQAFKDDAAYADYWRNYADEEARVAGNEAARTQRTTEAPGVTSERTPPTRPTILRPDGKVDDTVVGQRSLDTGLEKVAKGQAFALTAAEKVAMRGNAKAWGGMIEKGAADPDLLTALAIGGVGVSLALAYPDKAEDAGTLGAGLFLAGSMKHIEALPDAAPLSAIKSHMTTTFKTLEALPDNASVHKKSLVEEKLRMADVTKTEKEVIQSVLAAHEGETITPKKLVMGVKEATGDWELKKKVDEQYADYGLENIDRVEAPDDSDTFFSPEERAEPHPQQAETHIWQLPKEMGTDNHFGDPNYFAHTRTFEEGGVRHVVEIQSDLAQKAGKAPITEEVRAELATKLRDLDRQRQVIQDVMERHVAADRQVPMDVRRAGSRLDVEIAELQAKLSASGASSKIAPILKNWHKRIIREELADAVREREHLEERMRQMASHRDSMPDGTPGWDAANDRVKEFEAKLQDPQIVRFASADTVAKVEGWPDMRSLAERGYGEHGAPVENGKLKEIGKPRFRPEHQGIYNRYAGDITKFLKQLGGKEYTDSAGHTWIDVPYTKGMKRVQMQGSASTDLLIGIAAVGMGAVVGAQLGKDNPIVSAIEGAVAAMIIRNIPMRQIIQDFKAIKNSPKPERINDLSDAHDHTTAAGARMAAQGTYKITKLIPKKTNRIALFQAIDGKKAGQLTGAMAEGAALAREYFSGLHKLAAEKGVLDTFLEDYVTHLYDKKSQSKLAAMMNPQKFDPMSPNSKFNKTRVYPTMEEAKVAGLVPRTEDLAEIMSIYGNALTRTIANKDYIDALMKRKTGKGVPLVGKLGQSPGDYVTIDSPHFRGKVVHPDIAPSLRFMFEAQQPGPLMAVISGLSTALKRNAVAASFFHGTTLQHAMLGATNNPLLVIKATAQSAVPKLFNENRFVKQLRGGAGDLPDYALESGLKISQEFRDTAMEDVHGGSYYQAIDWLGKAMDKSIPHTGSIPRAYAEVNHMVDRFMWDRLHPAMKLEIFAAKAEELMLNNAKKGTPISKKEAGRIAASYTNDIFGGLNWRRIAEGIDNRYLRTLALDLFSPRGRRGMQILLFAPDWTLSTVRSLTQSYGKGTGLPGLVSPRTLTDLHRQQLIRSAFIYLTVGNALNYAFSGHPIWENKNSKGEVDAKAMTRIDLGDGRSLQLSKHLMEPIDWLIDPAQQALNKMGALPKQAAEQALGVEYLSAHGRPKPMDTSPQGRLAHVGKALDPIAIQQFRDGGHSAGVSGALGYPIYGKTEADKRKERLEKALKDYQQRHSNQGNKQ